MKNKEIIFFDDLGFGWVVNNDTIKKIKTADQRERKIIEKTLEELLGKDRYA